MMKGGPIDSPPNTQQQAEELLNDQKLLKKDFQIIEEDYPTPCEEFASFWSGMVTGVTTVEKPNANKIATTVRHNSRLESEKKRMHAQISDPSDPLSQ